MLIRYQASNLIFLVHAIFPFSPPASLRVRCYLTSFILLEKKPRQKEIKRLAKNNITHKLSFEPRQPGFKGWYFKSHTVLPCDGCGGVAVNSDFLHDIFLVTGMALWCVRLAGLNYSHTQNSSQDASNRVASERYSFMRAA